MEEKITAWIARDKDGELYIFFDKPSKATYNGWWASDSSDYFELDNRLFPQVKWEDKEPTKVELTIKICE